MQAHTDRVAHNPTPPAAPLTRTVTFLWVYDAAIRLPNTVAVCHQRPVRSRSSTLVRSEKPNLRNTSVRNIPQAPLIINGAPPRNCCSVRFITIIGNFTVARICGSRPAPLTRWREFRQRHQRRAQFLPAYSPFHHYQVERKYLHHLKYLITRGVF